MKLMRPVLAFLTFATATKASAPVNCNIDAVENIGETVFRSIHESWPAEIDYYQAPATQEDKFLKEALSQAQKASDDKQKLYSLGASCELSANTRQSFASIRNDVESRLKRDREHFLQKNAHINSLPGVSARQKKLREAKENLRRKDPNFDDSPNLKMPSPTLAPLPRNRKRRRDEL
jgi:hypothetical protein